MIIPAAFALRRQRFDRRPRAAVYGLLIGLTGAGGQLLLFRPSRWGRRISSFRSCRSHRITVLMAIALLRERINPLHGRRTRRRARRSRAVQHTGGDSDGSSTVVAATGGADLRMWRGVCKPTSCARRRPSASTKPPPSAGCSDQRGHPDPGRSALDGRHTDRISLASTSSHRGDAV